MADGGPQELTLLQKSVRRGRYKSLRLSQTVALSARAPGQRDAEVMGEGSSNTPDTTSREDDKEASKEKPAKVPYQPFRLMDLPLEVRTMIFKEHLVMPGPVLFRQYVQSEDPEVSFLASPHAIIDPQPSQYLVQESNVIWQEPLLRVFLTSKTIYRETVPIYFGINLFKFDWLEMFENFITKLGPQCRWQLGRLNLHLRGNAPARAIKHLVDCVGLRRLVLKIYSYSAAYHDQVAPYAPRLYGMKDLLKVRGLTKLDVDFSEYHPHYLSRNHEPEEAKSALLEQLQVLKQPQDPKKLKRLENKDFPARTMRRIVIGSANVVTRAEKRLLDAQ
ncbi:hypothetical protein G7Y79_00011g030790 [Physcia stellaris]|nr:hypothetical protein G7Y79_00011g030790 [Physcia stellaris]